MAKNNVAPLLGAAAVILLMMGGASSDSKPKLSDSDQRAYDKFKELAEKTGNNDYHPDQHPLEEVVRGFQMTMGVGDARELRREASRIPGVGKGGAVAEEPGPATLEEAYAYAKGVEDGLRREEVRWGSQHNGSQRTLARS